MIIKKINLYLEKNKRILNLRDGESI